MMMASMVALTGCGHHAAPRPTTATPPGTASPAPKSGSRYSQDQDSTPGGPPPDVSKIPEPVPKVEPRSQYGNKSPYTVLGETYSVLPEANGSNRFGAAHAVDIEYAFNTLDSKPAAWQAEDHMTALTLATSFANFVKTGNPNGPGVPDWPEFGKTRQVMYVDSVSKPGPEQGRARYEFIDSVGTR